MKYMDSLPTVSSCCCCCFLRAGTVLIAISSFAVGLLFVPNLMHTQGYWDMKPVLSNYSMYTEATAQMVLGIASILLCFISCLLLIGACCNVPALIEMYQWGVIVYSAIVLLMFSIMAFCCLFIHTNCFLGGGVLCILMAVLIMLSTYFIVVANSLRMSIKMLSTMHETVI